jgi:citrate synthase
MWMSADEALRRLRCKPQSLYANVSRGRIRAKPDPADQRRSLYSAEDIERLAARAHGRRPAQLVAAEAVNWGEPLFVSALSTVIDGRLSYRGVDAAVLARTASLTDVAGLLWGTGEVQLESPLLAATPSVETLFTELAFRAATASPVAGQASTQLVATASEVLALVAAALVGSRQQPLHEGLAALWRRPDAADCIRRALVLLADHELNASTFAARVVVSTGASLWAGTLAGLCALSGPRHGTASREVRALAEDLGGATAESELRDWLGEGRHVPGFGHRLYPDGDARVSPLLAGFEEPARFAAFRRAAESVTGELPNIDYALAAMTARFDLPSSAPMTLFALGRSVGWLAHMIEQIQSGKLIRPRARYVGVAPGFPQP